MKSDGHSGGGASSRWVGVNAAHGGARCHRNCGRPGVRAVGLGEPRGGHMWGAGDPELSFGHKAVTVTS